MDSGDITIRELSSPENERFFIVDFFGHDLKVTVTSTPSVVRKWIATTMFLSSRYGLRNRLVVGLGVQWVSSMVEPAASTLQLCVGSRCLVFQLGQAHSVPIALRRFLSDPNFTYVGIWNYSDEDRLLRSDHQLKMCSPPVDLRYAAAEKYGSDLVNASMETLASRVLGRGGVSKDRDVGMSNWNAEHLDHEQVLYAAVDAYVSFLMGKVMAVWSIR